MSTRTASEVRDELRSARSSGRIHSAYLLDGPEGTGKREVAHWLCRLLLCSADGPDPCEQCNSCHKSHLDPTSGAPLHTDWQRLLPDGNTFKIDQIRSLQRALSLTSQEGGRRVALLLEADALSTAAANALLKTLEEPPPRTSLILVARSGDALPSTIRSRSLRLRFRAARPAEIRTELERDGQDAEAAWLAATLCGGSTPACASWITENLEPARELFEELARSAGLAPDADPGAKVSISSLLDLSESFRGGGEAVRHRTELFFDVYEALCQREIRRHAGAPAGAESGLTRSGDASPDDASLDHWLSRAEHVARTRREWTRRNLNPQLAIEGLLFALRG